LLKRFEVSGWFLVGRERIEIRDAAALRALSVDQPAVAGKPV
jgi:hypothetical protein